MHRRGEAAQRAALVFRLGQISALAPQPRESAKRYLGENLASFALNSNSIQSLEPIIWDYSPELESGFRATIANDPHRTQKWPRNHWATQMWVVVPCFSSSRSIELATRFLLRLSPASFYGPAFLSLKPDPMYTQFCATAPWDGICQKIGTTGGLSCGPNDACKYNGPRLPDRPQVFEASSRNTCVPGPLLSLPLPRCRCV